MLQKKILNISAVDYGGAGNVAVQYHNLFKQFGYESALIVQDKKGENDAFVYKRTLFHKIKKRVYRAFARKIKFNPDYLFHNQYERLTTVSAKKLLSICPFEPDVIMLYWISDFINAKVIRELKRKTGAKIFWFMIDNAPITGGCHYPIECIKYLDSCQNCPAILSNPENSVAYKNILFKRRLLQDHIELIACSESDLARARMSFLFKKGKIHKLLVAINENIYNPGDENFARKELAIPNTEKVLFFGSANFNDKRKGFELLIKALGNIDLSNIKLVAAGKKPEFTFPYECIFLGYLNENQLILAFQAADIYLSPSIEDSGPMMVNQSLMCGTPVVAFDIGVANDLVINGFTGYCAKRGDYKEFAKGIVELLSLNESKCEEMVANCRNHALAYCSEEKFIKSFQQLIK